VAVALQVLLLDRQLHLLVVEVVESLLVPMPVLWVVAE
jgi:hypothetical protein